MSKQFIKDLKEGDIVQSEFRVSEVNAATAKTGNPYKRCKFSDKTGSLSGMCFLDSTQLDLIKDGDIVSVVGKVDSYQGKIQIKPTGIMLPRNVDDKDFDIATKYDVYTMFDKLVGYVNSMENDMIREVAEDLLLGQGYAERFKISPAATGMHHAFQGGLLEHTVQMAECADTLLKLEFFSPLNRDLCLFGILFHDFGKIFEYSTTSGFKKTLQGILVPHIPMMAALVFETCNKRSVPEIIRDHLMHVVLGHHMKLEWGSPVIPACPEAAFVHYVDNLHGTVFGWLQKIEANSASGAETIEKWDNGKSSLIVQSFDSILKNVEKARAEGF